MDGGNRERAPRGFDSHSYLGLGWSVEGGPRGPAAAALGGSGSGTRGREVVGWAALRVVVVVAELGGEAGVSL